MYSALTLGNSQRRMTRFCTLLLFIFLNISGMVNTKKKNTFLLQVEEKEKNLEENTHYDYAPRNDIIENPFLQWMPLSKEQEKEKEKLKEKEKPNDIGKEQESLMEKLNFIEKEEEKLKESFKEKLNMIEKQKETLNERLKEIANELEKIKEEVKEK